MTESCPAVNRDIPREGAKLGTSIMGAKSNWLIQLVVQCEEHTQHEEHALSRASGGIPSGKTLWLSEIEFGNNID